MGKVVEVVDPGGHDHDLREEEPDPQQSPEDERQGGPRNTHVT